MTQNSSNSPFNDDNTFLQSFQDAEGSYGESDSDYLETKQVDPELEDFYDALEESHMMSSKDPNKSGLLSPEFLTKPK